MNRQIKKCDMFQRRDAWTYSDSCQDFWIFIFDLLRQKINRGDEIRRDAQRRSWKRNPRRLTTMSRHIIKVRNNKTKDTKRQRQDGGEIMSKEESKLSVQESFLYMYLFDFFQLIIAGEHFYFYMKLLGFNQPQPQQRFNRVCACIIATTLLHPEEKSSAYSTRTNYLFERRFHALKLMLKLPRYVIHDNIFSHRLLQVKAASHLVFRYIRNMQPIISESLYIKQPV